MNENDRNGHHEIETTRLRLRQPRLSDARQLAILADNWAVASMLSRMPYPYHETDAIKWIKRSRTDSTESAFVITLGDTNAVIGACGIGPTTWTEGRQIGYWLGEPYWGRGYATEAAQAMATLAFDNPELTHLWCSCRVTNERSRGVIHNCGFQFHGAGLLFMRAANASIPVEHYCLDRSVWLALSSWRAA